MRRLTLLAARPTPPSWSVRRPPAVVVLCALTAVVATVLLAVAVGSGLGLLALPVALLPAPVLRAGTSRTQVGVAVGCVAASAATATVGPVHAAAGAALAIALGAAAAAAGWWWRRDLDRLGEELAAARQRAERVGMLDDVTGAVNRHGLVLLGGQVLQEVRRRGDSAHAVLVEVGALEDVRANLGAPAGDEVLAAVADALRVGTRATDVVARWGTDVFAVVGPGSGSVPAELERRVRVHLLDDPPVPPRYWPCRLTAGAGVLEPWDGGSLDELLGRAAEDLSLRRALRAPSAPEPPLPRRRA